jgi:predicted phage terminase large subunit-like protein
MSNLKDELETNQLLRSDLGPFQMPEDEWRLYSIVLPKYKARITAVSSEQSIRGLRHGPYRPDLIICDDIEDLELVKTQEGRNKIYQWLTGDVIPAGDNNTRLIIVGTILHEDSLIRRLQKKIDRGTFNGIYKEYPITNEENQPLWPGKFPDKESIEREKRKVMSGTAWQREYYFKIISDSNRVVWPEWIKYYDRLPNKKDSKLPFRYTVTGIDLAISEKERAHYTAMVSADVYGYGDNIKIYILPYPVNKRMNFPDTLKTAENLSKRLGNGQPTKLFIESVYYQKSVIQELRKRNFPAEEVLVLGQDKKARLEIITPTIENGTVLFPKKGAEILINQLIGFGSEKYDDLADAFAMLIGEIMKENKPVYHLTDGMANSGRGNTILGNLMDKKF